MIALQKIRAILQHTGTDMAVLDRRDNFAWLTDGGNPNVAERSEFGDASVVVTPDEVFVLANNIELPRLVAEELGDLPATPLPFPWYADKASALRNLIGGRSVAADHALQGAVDISAALVTERSVLTEEQMHAYRAFAPIASQCVESVLRRVEPGWTEMEIQAEVVRECSRHGIRPAVVLVGVDHRVRDFRHTVATAAALERYVMIVLCAEKHGLIANTTRLATFGPLPDELAVRHQQTARILSVMNEQTVPGRQLHELWSTLTQLYKEAGYPGQWEKHHQGGLTGYAPREWLLNPASTGEVVPNTAYAWNPTIEGAKSEDTILVTASGPEVITLTADWPTVTVTTPNGKTQRAAVLER